MIEMKLYLMVRGGKSYGIKAVNDSMVARLENSGWTLYAQSAKK